MEKRRVSDVHQGQTGEKSVRRGQLDSSVLLTLYNSIYIYFLTLTLFTLYLFTSCLSSLLAEMNMRQQRDFSS